MPRRLILSATERDTLLALPESQDDLIRYYTFNDSDLSLIRQRRGDANRLGLRCNSACCVTPAMRWAPTASCVVFRRRPHHLTGCNAWCAYGS